MIQTSNLWKRFGRHDALQGLSFTAPEGSAYALIGANGAGKTTTIKVLMNILEPTRGSAAILGVDSRRSSRLRKLSRCEFRLKRISPATRDTSLGTTAVKFIRRFCDAARTKSKQA